MTIDNWIMVGAVLVGPICAVLITLWIEQRRRAREQKLAIFRMLINTRHLPADPAFQIAINLIPIEFSSNRSIVQAQSDFVQAANRQNFEDLTQRPLEATSTKLSNLISEIANDLGYRMKESDISFAGYASKGWSEREAIILDGHQAMRDIATVLAAQADVPTLPAETHD